MHGHTPYATISTNHNQKHDPFGSQINDYQISVDDFRWKHGHCRFQIIISDIASNFEYRECNSFDHLVAYKAKQSTVFFQ